MDALAARAGAAFRRHGASLLAKGVVGGEDLTFVKPQAFMNCSGPVVADLVDALGIPMNEIIIVHDDIDLDPGRVRFKARGGHGGHNGVLSVIDALDTSNFPRLKIGVGRPPEGVDAADYVLAPLRGGDRAVLEDAVRQAVSALECWVSEGLATAMTRFNRVSSK